MRHLVMFASLLVALLVLAAPAMAQSVDLNCDDFGTQEEAQTVYDSDTSDPHRLDADDDGIACETLPSSGSSGGAESTADFSTPERAELGGGGAGGVDPFLAIAAATGALASFTGAVHVARRGR